METSQKMYENCGTYGGYKKHKKYKTPTCEDCRTASRERSRTRRALNPIKTKQENKVWYLKNRETILERNNRFRKDNPEYVKQYQDAYRASHKKEREEYRLNHLEKFRNYARKRKAWKLQTNHEYYSEQEVFDLYGTNCHICNESIDLSASRKVGVDNWKKGLHLDHVIPLSKGGSDTLLNVRPAHAECNLFKNAKIQHEVLNG